MTICDTDDTVSGWWFVSYPKPERVDLMPSNVQLFKSSCWAAFLHPCLSELLIFFQQYITEGKDGGSYWKKIIWNKRIFIRLSEFGNAFVLVMEDFKENMWVLGYRFSNHTDPLSSSLFAKCIM